jgi:arylsulfatase A-like enzyme
MVQLYESVMPGTGPVPRELVQDVIDQYDVAVANVDEGFGSLLERLRAMDVYDSTLIIVTSDHGEYFGEHHLVEHVKDVYQEAVRVPLIIKYPGQARARREAALVSSVDVPALILSAFPRELAGRLGQGFANSPGSHPVVSEVYYSERKDVYHPLWGSRFRRVRTALFEPPYKYIASSDGKNELYHLENDATESRNLIDEEPETARRLAGKLREFMDTGAPGAVPADPPPLTEEEKENLRSLGYSGN